MSWDGMTPEQQCVIVNAIDEGDLHALLYMWDADWRDNATLSNLVTRLGAALVDLVAAGLVEAYTEPDSGRGPLARDEVAEAVTNEKAWWNGDDGLEAVIWTVLTEEGTQTLSSAPPEGLYAFRQDRCRS